MKPIRWHPIMREAKAEMAMPQNMEVRETRPMIPRVTASSKRVSGFLD